MERLSVRMKRAGWVVLPLPPDRWEAIAPEGRRFIFSQGGWEPGVEELIAQLESDERRVNSGSLSPYLGTARLVEISTARTPTHLSHRVAHDRLCADMSVLRVLPRPDPIGDELLMEAGARRVQTLLAPWPNAPTDTRTFPCHLLLCEHVAGLLPPEDRMRMLRALPSHLHADAHAYVSFFTMERMPSSARRRDYQDGYLTRLQGHEVFVKPWLPMRAVETLEKAWGGTASLAWNDPHEFVVRWSPYS